MMSLTSLYYTYVLKRFVTAHVCEFVSGGLTATAVNQKNKTGEQERRQREDEEERRVRVRVKGAALLID